MSCNHHKSCKHNMIKSRGYCNPVQLYVDEEGGFQDGCNL